MSPVSQLMVPLPIKSLPDWQIVHICGSEITRFPYFVGELVNLRTSIDCHEELTDLRIDLYLIYYIFTDLTILLC
jgi:hypothetical protein